MKPEGNLKVHDANVYISQFTYYCGNADHASPYPQETFYHKPKALHWDQCKELASLGRYIAGDDKTYEVALNTRTEVPYFAYGSATAYTGNRREPDLHVLVIP